jgi:hypothetical protein
MPFLSLDQLLPMHGLVQVAPLKCFTLMVIPCSAVLPYFFRAAFMDTCAMTMPTISVHLCRPFPINFTNLCAMHRVSTLPCNDNVIWVRAMAYLLPFMLGTYFSGAFLAREFCAAIPILGGAVFLAGLFAFFGLLVGPAVGTAAAPSVDSCCSRPSIAIAYRQLGHWCPWPMHQCPYPLLWA